MNKLLPVFIIALVSACGSDANTESASTRSKEIWEAIVTQDSDFKTAVKQLRTLKKQGSTSSDFTDTTGNHFHISGKSISMRIQQYDRQLYRDTTFHDSKKSIFMVNKKNVLWIDLIWGE